MNDENPDLPKSYVPQPVIIEAVKSVESIYTLLEFITHHEAKFFSDSGKANMRRAQAQLQRLRLFLLDAKVCPDNSIDK